VSIFRSVHECVGELSQSRASQTNFILSLQFNRGMDTTSRRSWALTNPVGGAGHLPGGRAGAHRSFDDTFTLPPITFSTGMDGTNTVYVSNAPGLEGRPTGADQRADFAVDSRLRPALLCR